MNITNAKIEDIGLYVVPHYNVDYISLILRLDGGKCEVRIPDEKIVDAVKYLFDDISEDGLFLHELKGRYIRIQQCDNGQVSMIGHIIKNSWIGVA